MIRPALTLSLLLSTASVLHGQAMGDSLLPEWLPTELPSGRNYVGNAICKQCHAAQAGYEATAMANALQSATGSTILGTQPHLSFEGGGYRYEIVREGDGSRYTVSDGKHEISASILWSFGQGKAGQTYIIEREGSFYESRVSYYLEKRGLDWTLGAPADAAPASLEEAAGRRMGQDDVRGCFGCHSTGAIRSSQVDLGKLIPGITCEGCHGPGDAHAAVVAGGRTDEIEIPRLSNQTAEEQSDFCGSCHRTWSQVMMMGQQGVSNVRFQPYRLANAACYDTEDARIRCAACHDPHEDPRHDARYYDAKCLDCHASSAADAPCPVGKESCAECHMPKYEIPGSHFRFTDHQIRIVREGEAYPN